MTNFLECIFAFLATAGLFWLLWLLFGHLLRPAPGGHPGLMLLPVSGDANGLEQSVRHLLWLRGGELLTFPIVLVDVGLNDAGRAQVARLMAAEPSLRLCSADALPGFWQKDG